MYLYKAVQQLLSVAQQKTYHPDTWYDSNKNINRFAFIDINIVAAADYLSQKVYQSWFTLCTRASIVTSHP